MAVPCVLLLQLRQVPGVPAHRLLGALRDQRLAVGDQLSQVQLKRDLAVTVSAEALFTLTDLCGLGQDEAIARAAQTAATLTAAAFSGVRETRPVRD